MEDLLAKIRRIGVPLAEFAGVKPLYGIKTGLNEAFLIDTPTRDRLIRDEPQAAEIIKPYLRGQDIRRWSPQWADLWMIVLQSSSDHAWPWSDAADAASAEDRFRQVFPTLHAHLKPLEEKLRTRLDKGRFWWELRACAYYHIFGKQKLMYQEIQFHPSYCFDSRNLFSNNKVFFLPTADTYLLAVLNSPLMWWHNWPYLPHMKDEALSPMGVKMEALPIAPPADGVRAEAEQAVARLIEMTRVKQDAQHLMLDWLRAEFEVQEPGARLEDFSAIDVHVFVAEVLKRRSKSAGKLTPAALRDLQRGYAAQLMPLQQFRVETAALERKLSDLVNAAYGLTPEEVALLWSTAPPRMPLLSQP